VTDRPGGGRSPHREEEKKVGSGELLQQVYDRLYAHFGPQHWWPAETPFEVLVGAILTQNANWKNVEKAIANLRDAGFLSLERMAELPPDLLAEYIRPSGYYNIKAGRLRNLLEHIRSVHGGDLDAFLGQPPEALREELLSIRGIGPETADSMILYGAGWPVFVVDTYTHRILSRHGIIPEEYGYCEIQELFTDNLPPDTALFNEYHALLVRTGKEYCRKSNPRCDLCPLQSV